MYLCVNVQVKDFWTTWCCVEMSYSYFNIKENANSIAAMLM